MASKRTNEEAEVDIQERRRTLVAQLQQIQAGINQAVVQMHRIEGAIALLDEQLKEDENGDGDVPSGTEQG